MSQANPATAAWRAARRRVRATWLLCAVLGAAGCAAGREQDPGAQPRWERLETGLELGTFPASQPAAVGDSLIRVLRIDPESFELRLLNASHPDHGSAASARDWCARHRLVAAINASMYQEDLRTSVSMMRSRTHTNNPRLTRDKAVLAFDRSSLDVPPVKIVDLECEPFEDWEGRYRSFVQSIRMLSCKGQNVWAQQARKWSTAAVGTDDRGRVLFIHVRSPYSIHDLIDLLVELPIGIERLMYAEGGPEAQLFVHGDGRELEFVGGFEAATRDDDNNHHAWPVPNVLGVVRRRR